LGEWAPDEKNGYASLVGGQLSVYASFYPRAQDQRKKVVRTSIDCHDAVASFDKERMIESRFSYCCHFAGAEGAVEDKTTSSDLIQ